MLLDNASTYGRLEGALATLELLLAGATASPAGPAPFFPACCSVMRRNGKVEAAVSVVLDEALGEEGDNEVTILLGELMRHLPAPSRAEAEVLAAEAAAPARLMHPARSPATTNPPTGHGGTQRGAGFTSLDVNTQRYDSTTFLVGGREFYALGWVMEQASGLLGRLIRQAGDPKAPVAVPTVEGLGDDRAYELFSLAVEYSYTGYAAISPDEALDLWAVAASLEMEELQAHCEDLVASVLTVEREPLAASLALSNRYRSGNRLRDLCVSHILDNLTDFNESGLLKEVLAAGREKIEEGAVHVLSDRFLVASRKRHVFRAP